MYMVIRKYTKVRSVADAARRAKSQQISAAMRRKVASAAKIGDIGSAPEKREEGEQNC